jgi:hypothetical protein
MKNMKFFSVLVAVGILLTPACALAKTHFSFSLNLFDCLRPMCLVPAPIVVAPLPPPPVYFVPVQPPNPYIKKRIRVEEYHHHHYYPVFSATEKSISPHP